MRNVKLSHSDLLALAQDVLGQGGVFRFKAQGNSMRPFIRSGDMLTVVPVAAEALQRDDVVLYCTPHQIIVHRLVGMDGPVLLIRGDASRSSEADRVMPDQVLGRVIQVDRGRWRYDPRRPWWRWLALAWHRDAHWLRVALVLRRRVFGLFRR